MAAEIRKEDAVMYSIGGREPLDAFVHVCKWHDDHFVFFLHVRPESRGQGLADRLMTQVCEDYPGTLHLSPRPFSDSPLNAEELRNFYRRYGFVDNDQGDWPLMTRPATDKTQKERV